MVLIKFNNALKFEWKIKHTLKNYMDHQCFVEDYKNLLSIIDDYSHLSYIII